ncbi:GNAT family N-acetyltransferase [Novosphingobium sp.]|uniref:GNAT family N-acetyltransferase n=1 Tax=Novosphingobium sp. TaxID=1874826 RepID=UPI0025D2D1AB|nr:GNAT family N-acetyltransferase [Novosphingobium sp.]
MGIDGPLEWRIRPAGPDDGAALALVAQATFLEAYAGLVQVGDMLAHCASQNSAEAFRSALDEGAKAWLVEAVKTGAPLGFALLMRSALPDPQPGDIELKRIYLLDRCKGQGLAGDLLGIVVAGAAGYRRLMLGTNKDNERALGFYRKSGFKVVGTRTFTVGTETFDDYILAKPLETS